METRNEKKKRKYRNKKNREWNLKKEVKLGQKCAECGEDNVVLLEFAHFNRENKSVNLSDGRGSDVIRQELHKGRFLCVWCHRIETKRENNIIKLKNKQNTRYNESEENMELDENAIKCSGPLCLGKTRHSSFFYTNKKCQNCKKCWSLYHRKRREKSHKFGVEQKLKIGKCELCNIKVTEEISCCFDFDHIDRKTKIANITSLTSRGESFKKILEEISKCRLLCCKCHRIHTASQLNYVDYTTFEYNYEEKENTDYCIAIAKHTRQQCKNSVSIEGEHFCPAHGGKTLNKNDAISIPWPHIITVIVRHVMFHHKTTSTERDIIYWLGTLSIFSNNQSEYPSSSNLKQWWNDRPIKDLIQLQNSMAEFLGENASMNWFEYIVSVHTLSQSQPSDNLPVIESSDSHKTDIINLDDKHMPKDNKKKNTCIDCQSELYDYRAKRCVKCAHVNSRKCTRPPKDVLLDQIKTLGYCGTGRIYKVSDNTIRKWLKAY